MTDCLCLQDYNGALPQIWYLDWLGEHAAIRSAVNHSCIQNNGYNIFLSILAKHLTEAVILLPTQSRKTSWTGGSRQFPDFAAASVAH